MDNQNFASVMLRSACRECVKKALATSRKNYRSVFMKILPEMYLWTRKSPLYYGGHPDLNPELGSF